MPGTGWTLVIQDDWAAATASTRGYADVLLALVAVGVALPAAGMVLLYRRARAETREQARCEQAGQAVALFHSSLLPGPPPLLPGWRLAVDRRPAETHSGDFHDRLLLPDGRLMVALGDVSDPGVPGALAAATARAALRGAAQGSVSPALALAQANDLLCPDMPPGQGVTCAYAVVEPSDGRLQLAGAGGAPSFLVRGGAVRTLKPTGEPLGLALGSRYRQHQLKFRPGDRLVLVSDGALQARNAEGEAFGPERLREVLKRQAGSGESLWGLLLSELRAFAGDAWAQDEDITLASLERVEETAGAVRLRDDLVLDGEAR